MSDQIKNNQGQKKKGLSKGCLIALIVVGVLALMVITAGIVCYAKRDALLKSGGSVMVGSFKAKLMENPIEGVDTVEVNRVGDAFLLKLEESELDFAKYSLFAKEVQYVTGRTDIDSVKVEQFIQAMIDYFPELQDIRSVQEVQDDTAVGDTSLVP